MYLIKLSKVCCEDEEQKYSEEKEFENAKIIRVKEQAKATLRSYSEDKKNRSIEVQGQIETIKKMKDDMIDRAAAIMARR